MTAARAYAAPSTRATSSATGMDPASLRSCAKAFASRWSVSFTGVGTPSSAISPLR